MFAETDDVRSKHNGNHPANVGAAIFSVGAIFALLRPLRWFLFFRSLGLTVVCIIRVLWDAFHVFLIYIIVLGAFSTGIFSMYKPFGLRDQSGQNQMELNFSVAEENQTEFHYGMAEDDLKTPKGMFSAMFWLLFDPGQPDFVAIKKCGGIEDFSCNSTDEKLEIGLIKSS